MQHAHLVGIIQRIAYLVENVDQPVKREQIVRRGMLFECAAIHIFHHQIIKLLRVAILNNMNDERMLKLARQTCFIEPHPAVERAVFIIVKQIQLGKFEGNVLLQVVVEGKVNHPCGALSQLLFHLEAITEVFCLICHLHLLALDFVRHIIFWRNFAPVIHGLAE